MQNRVCVFCGQTPENQNKEHVIPKWLFKATGELNRKIIVGVDWDTGKERVWSANSFAFPACKQCNDTYSVLEKLAQPIVMKAVNSHAVSSGDVTTLLDWFDKIRVGIWLGQTYLNKKSLPVTPSFYINDRVGSKDRGLFIYRIATSGSRLVILGTLTPIFTFLPSCFGILVNDTIFLNFSYDFLFARQAGFPYMEFTERNTDGKLFGKVKLGTEKVDWSMSHLGLKSIGLGIFQVCLPSALPNLPKWYRIRCESDDPLKSFPLVQLNDIVISEFESNKNAIWNIPTMADEPNYSLKASALAISSTQECLFKLHYDFTRRKACDNEQNLYNMQRKISNKLLSELTENTLKNG